MLQTWALALFSRFALCSFFIHGSLSLYRSFCQFSGSPTSPSAAHGNTRNCRTQHGATLRQPRWHPGQGAPCLPSKGGQRLPQQHCCSPFWSFPPAAPVAALTRGVMPALEGWPVDPAAHRCSPFYSCRADRHVTRNLHLAVDQCQRPYSILPCC